MSNDLTPEELWDRLALLHSNRFYKMRPDLDMLREVYQENKQRVEGQAARESFENALKDWTADQMRQFLSEWVFEPPQLPGIETASLDRLRDFLKQVYKYIFE